MRGAPTLVPPTLCIRFFCPKLSMTRTPVAGSATAETSAPARLAQLVVIFPCWTACACQGGILNRVLQPPPAPSLAFVFQAVSVPSGLSVVPPTLTTLGQFAGFSTSGLPESPELAVMTTPGWLKN